MCASCCAPARASRSYARATATRRSPAMGGRRAAADYRRHSPAMEEGRRTAS